MTAEQERVLTHLRAGRTYREAALGASVLPSALEHWLRDGARPGSPHAEFSKLAREARAQVLASEGAIHG